MKQRLIALMGVCVLAVACAQTDSGVTAKVKSKLTTDDTVKAAQVDVDTKDKVVTLSGTVESDMERQRAIEIARNTEGVRDVIDNISVRASELPAAGMTGEQTGTDQHGMHVEQSGTGTTGQSGTDPYQNQNPSQNP